MRVTHIGITKDRLTWTLGNRSLEQLQAKSVHGTKQKWDKLRKTTSLTVLWEADLDKEGILLNNDLLRLALTGRAPAHYIQNWMVNIRDATTQIHGISNFLGNG